MSHTAEEIDLTDIMGLADKDAQHQAEEYHQEAVRAHLADLKAKAEARDRFDQERALTEALGTSTVVAQDYADVLDGTYETPSAEMLRRTDGEHLIYQGKVNALIGESESGKSLLAQALAVETINSGGRVLYMDFESDVKTVVSRLLQIGVDRDRMDPRAGFFRYVNTESRHDATRADQEAWEEHMQWGPALVVIDGVNSALGVYGRSYLDTEEYTKWFRELPYMLEQRHGITSVLVDHVTKSKDNRGRFAIGSQAKISTLTGVGLIVDVDQAPAAGHTGRLRLHVAKDRPGGVRAIADQKMNTDRTQLTAVVTISSTSKSSPITVVIDPPDALVRGVEAKRDREEAKRAEDVREVLARAGEPLGRERIRSHIGCSVAAITKALESLVEDGEVKHDKKKGYGLAHWAF